MDGGFVAIDGVEEDQRVDLQVREVQVDVDRVQADEEVNEGLALRRGDVLEEGGRDGGAGGEGRADGDGVSSAW